jgi:uncharacterized caspase-like protein
MLWIFLLYCFWARSVDAFAEVRKALVVANSAYAHSKSLPNPGNDAALLKQRLEALGFTVDLRLDLTADQFFDVLSGFVSKVTKDTEPAPEI